MKSTFATMGFIGFLLAGMSHCVLSLGVDPAWPWIVLGVCGMAIVTASIFSVAMLLIGRTS